MCIGTAIGGEAEKSASAAKVGVVYNAGDGADVAETYGDLDDPSEIKLLVLDSYEIGRAHV